jgi:hypothetical protein
MAKKKKSKSINILVVVVLIVVVFFIYQKMNPKSTGSSPSVLDAVKSTITPNKESTTTTHEAETILKKGDSSNVVKQSQIRINQVRTKLGIQKLSEDGIFGANTEQAFIALLGKSTGSFTQVVFATQAL